MFDKKEYLMFRINNIFDGVNFFDDRMRYLVTHCLGDYLDQIVALDNINNCLDDLTIDIDNFNLITNAEYYKTQFLCTLTSVLPEGSFFVLNREVKESYAVINLGDRTVVAYGGEDLEFGIEDYQCSDLKVFKQLYPTEFECCIIDTPGFHADRRWINNPDFETIDGAITDMICNSIKTLKKTK